MGVDHRPNEISPVPSSTFTTSRSPYAGEFFGAAFPDSSRLPWPSLRMTSSALPCSPLGANLSALQDSPNVAGCGFALLSQEVTTLQHLRSPRSTGCLLRGCLTITATGLPPASRRQLSGHTRRALGGHCRRDRQRQPPCIESRAAVVVARQQHRPTHWDVLRAAHLRRRAQPGHGSPRISCKGPWLQRQRDSQAANDDPPGKPIGDCFPLRWR
jgi:hypothetical protein